MVNAISLFIGADGMDVGFERAGTRILLAYEIDSKAAETYKLNHPDANMIVDDINNIWVELENIKAFILCWAGLLVKVFPSLEK